MGGGDLATPVVATGKPEAEQGAIQDSFRAAVAGDLHGIQLDQGDRSLLAWARAALDLCPRRATEHGADCRLLAGIDHLLEAVPAVARAHGPTFALRPAATKTWSTASGKFPCQFAIGRAVMYVNLHAEDFDNADI